MPKGPQGQKRPSDVIGGAVKVMRIATGEEPDDREEATSASAAAQLGRLGGAARARTVGRKANRDGYPGERAEHRQQDQPRRVYSGVSGAMP